MAYHSLSWLFLPPQTSPALLQHASPPIQYAAQIAQVYAVAKFVDRHSD
jgi:hypothetical protein